MSPSLRSFVDDLARAEIGSTFNQYAASPLRRARLAAYLSLRASARTLLVGEAAGYRGARVSGIPFTSERQLNGHAPGEPSATIVHSVLRELELEHDVLLSTAGLRDLPERQQTMNATVAWSYQLLDANERRAFRRFGAEAILVGEVAELEQAADPRGG